MFKKFFFCSAAFLTLMAADAQPLRTPIASPAQTVKQEFGITTAELTYARPNVRGRKVFGDLVPYGKLWRTGANATTRIKFADDVKIGDSVVKAGEYAIYTIPNENEWEVIINKGFNNQSVLDYKKEQDVVRVKVKPTKLNESQETYTMQFVNLKPTGADLQIMWEKTAVNVPITMDVDKKVMAQIDNLINKDNRPYFQAAMYFMESGKDMNQALSWFDKAIEQNPNAFWIHHQRANALAKLGKKEEARTAANKSIELAKAANNDDYVKLNEKLLVSLK